MGVMVFLWKAETGTKEEGNQREDHGIRVATHES
jgi:hypothetical protein